MASSLTINEYCKNYRISKGVKQSDIGKIPTISAFENGRSTNLNHISLYAQIAKDNNDLDGFFEGMKGIFNV